MQKGTTGQHYKPDRKTIHVSLRMTENDYKVIRRKAELLGCSVSDYIVASALGRRVKGYSAKDVDLGVPGQMGLDDIQE